MLLMPIVFILILGNALSSSFAPSDIGITKAVYLSRDTGSMHRQFEEFLAGDAVKELLHIVQVNTYEEGEALLRDREAAAMIILSEGYSEAVASGARAPIEVYSSRYDTFRASVVESLLEGFVHNGNIVVSMMKLGSTAPAPVQFKNLQNVPMSAKGTVPGAIDYYAVTILVMTLMYGSLYAAHGVAEDFLENMGKRLRSTPARSMSLYIGNMIGFVAVVFIQGLILIAFTAIVFKANWGDNLPMVLFIAFSLTVLSTALGMSASLLTRDRKVGTSLISLFVPLFTFISGGYAKIMDNNTVIKAIQTYGTPNSLGHTALFNTIYDGSQSHVWISLAVIWGLVAAAFTICYAAGRRRFH